MTIVKLGKKYKRMIANAALREYQNEIAEVLLKRYRGQIKEIAFQNYRRKITGEIFWGFMKLKDLNPAPEYFGLFNEDFKDSERELFNEGKRYAFALRDFMLSLPTRQRVELITRKVLENDLDHYLSRYLDGQGNLFKEGWEITDARYWGRMILYRIPRNLRVPHFVYRFLLRHPIRGEKVIYVKVYHRVNFEGFYIKVASLCGVRTNRITYFPRTQDSVWVFQEEIANGVEMNLMPANDFKGVRERVVHELAEHAAVGDVLRKYDRSPSNYLILAHKPEKTNTVYSIDNELLLGSVQDCESRVNRGKREMFFLWMLPGFSSEERMVRYILQFKRFYLSKWNEIVRKRREIREIINSSAKEVREKALPIYEEEISKDPLDRLEKMYERVLDWGLRGLIVKDWQALYNEKDRIALGYMAISNYLVNGDETAYRALKILFNPYYSEKIKLAELSIDSSIWRLAEKIILGLLEKCGGNRAKRLQGKIRTHKMIKEKILVKLKEN